MPQNLVKNDWLIKLIKEYRFGEWASHILISY